MWAYALVCVCNCMCLSILVFICIASIYAYTCIHRSYGHACMITAFCMLMSICMRLDVYAFCIRYSQDYMPTDSAVGTHLNTNLSTMMHIVATNFAGALCIVPARNTHAILLI